MRITVAGLRPHERVILRAITDDDEKRRWSSQAEFRADGSGFVDAPTMESLGGTYRGASPMGLFWSMRLEDDHA
ncbi:MAG: acyl-CoA thioesterase/BAAT N-terminal domain-containing protein, partial [Candidatus Acidiferrales bacterium]